MARSLPEPVLFVDECLGSTDVPSALKAAGIQVEVLHAHFAPGTTDEDWLADVGSRGWVVLTKDQRIRRRHAEFQALLAARVAAVDARGKVKLLTAATKRAEKKKTP